MKISLKDFNLQSGHKYMLKIAMFNVQRAITPNVGKSELLFLCSARCLIVLYIFVKFRENITNGMKRTRVHVRNDYVQFPKGNNSKIKLTRVTVPAFCMSSYDALH